MRDVGVAAFCGFRFAMHLDFLPVSLALIFIVLTGLDCGNPGNFIVNNFCTKN